MSGAVPQNAAIAVLAFLGTVLVLMVCLLAFPLGLWLKSRRILRGATATDAMVLARYSAILLGLSVFSREVRLPMGSWKHFCEIDCHIANSVSNVETAANVGSSATLQSRTIRTRRTKNVLRFIHDRSAARKWATHAKRAVGDADRRLGPGVSRVLASGGGAVRDGIAIDSSRHAATSRGGRPFLD